MGDTFKTRIAKRLAAVTQEKIRVLQTRQRLMGELEMVTAQANSLVGREQELVAMLRDEVTEAVVEEAVQSEGSEPECSECPQPEPSAEGPKFGEAVYG